MNNPFLYLFFSFKGRIDRKTFWFGYLCVLICGFINTSLWQIEELFLINLPVLIMIIWASFAVQTKRWHDRNKSGFMFIINAIPYLGFFWWLIELGFLKGTAGPNKYGNSAFSIFRDALDSENNYGTKQQTYYDNFQQSANSSKTDETNLPEHIKNLIAMFAKIAKSDGVISIHEVKMIDTFFKEELKLDSKARSEAIKIFNEAKNSNINYEIFATEFYKRKKLDVLFLTKVMDFIFFLALADGELSAEEEILLNQTMAIFNLVCEPYYQYKQRFKKDKANTKTKRQECMEILGLVEPLDIEKVKKAYRELALQYHPDKVSHLGPKLRQVAEEEMKRINEAYEHLCKELTKNQYYYAK